MYQWTWEWDSSLENPNLLLTEKNLGVKFHPNHSTGTAAIRGNDVMRIGCHYYWEIKILTFIHGTDVVSIYFSKSCVSISDIR